ncbi:MAG: putative ATP-dependent DNA helicase, partial [Streblomastix strix]
MGSTLQSNFTTESRYIVRKVGQGDNKEQIINWNEVKEYSDGLFMCAMEGWMRAEGIPLQKLSHAIKRLAVHLKDEQKIFFNEDQELLAAETADKKKSTLMAFFDLNQFSKEKYGEKITDNKDDSRNYQYSEIPEFFTFKIPERQWCFKSKKGKSALGRIYHVPVKEKELYYLRVLLHHIKGACNYEDQRTVNGIQFETNHDAVQYLGLLADDQEWIFALNEAATLRMPQQLRELFVYILLFCNPENPQNLFNNFITQLSEDFLLKNNNDEKLSMWLAFLDISEIYGDTYPPLDTMIKCQCPDSYDNQFEYSANVFKTNDQILTLENLNDTQRIYAQEIINAVKDESIIQRCFFLDGPAGTGKTYTYNVLNYILDNEGFNVLNCAYTGIAATPLPE